MGNLILAVFLVLIVIFFTPFLIYSLFTLTAGLKPPVEKSPLLFFLGILISKLGTAAVFVLLFYFSRHCLNLNWLLYALLWWVMLVTGEIGEAVGPRYTWKEAAAGIVSETIYVPLSALIVSWLVR